MTGKEGLFSDARHLSSVLLPLLLAAERVASAVHQGTHGRRRAGQGESFWQFRRYDMGDAAQRIDWRQSARSDKLFIREREWDAAQSVYLWADPSGSMRYTSQKYQPTKAERAQLLMLAFASLLLRGGEKVIWLGDKPITVTGKNGLERIATAVDFAREGNSQPPPIRLVKHAHMVLASDFLMPPAVFDALMHRYAAMNLKGVLLHILDPAEQNLPFEGRVEMLGCENEAPLLLPNAASLRAAYREKMQEHQERLMHVAHAAGWFYLRHVTNAAPHGALLQLFQYLTADDYPFAQPAAQRSARGM
jgi:uncharacterized protein (DUF58 family)